jgi:hypothetical protein
MFQRIATCPFSLRDGVRLPTWLLCICLIVPLAWHEAGFGAPARLAGAPTLSSLSALLVAGHPGGHGPVVRQKVAPPHLPALVPASNPATGTGLRSGSRDDDPAFAQSPMPWGGAGAALRLPSLRIDPVAWDSGTPSFLLPSAHGLVLFAIPPPLRG